MNKILFLFLSSRLMFLSFALLAVFFIPERIGYLGNQLYPNQHRLIWIWANFDGRHFLDIAELGYDKYNFAFFPLYPLLISFVKNVLPIPALYIGILISMISLFISTIIIYKIIKLDYKENIARLSIILLLFSPLAFFYHSIYADSLFLLFTTASFYFARKGNWFLSGIFGALSVLTRLSGIVLIPALAVEWYIQNRKSLNLRFFLKTGFIALLLTSLGLIIYMVYLQVFFGDFLLFQKSMLAWNQDKWVFPLQVVWRYLKIFYLVDKTQLVYWIAVLELFSMMAYISLAIYVWKKVRASYGVFMIGLLSLIAFTGTFAGTPRYILHLFPAFLGLALLIKDKKILMFITMVTYLILGFILTALFTRGYFIS